MPNYLKSVCCFVLLLATVSAAASPADGAFLAGNDLLKWCDKEPAEDQLAEAAEELLCRGYVRGVIETSHLLMISGVIEKTLCLPEGATYEQALLVVMKYFRDNPQDMHNLAVGLVIGALREAWPCESS